MSGSRSRATACAASTKPCAASPIVRVPRLHRVTPVGGDRTRINAVLAYSERPGDTMNALTQELFYGRSAT